MPLPRFKEGDPISAAKFNEVIAAIEAASALTVDGSSGLEIDEAGGRKVIRAVGRGRPAYFAKTPSGGIPARTGSDPYTLGSAECVIYRRVGATVSSTSRTETVYNSNPLAVGGDLLIQVKLIDGGYLADVEPCEDA